MFSHPVACILIGKDDEYEKLKTHTKMMDSVCKDLKTFVHLRNTNKDIFDEIQELSDPP